MSPPPAERSRFVEGAVAVAICVAGLAVHQAALIAMVIVESLGPGDTMSSAGRAFPVAALVLWVTAATSRTPRRVLVAAVPWAVLFACAALVSVIRDDTDTHVLAITATIAHVVAYLVARRRAR